MRDDSQAQSMTCSSFDILERGSTQGRNAIDYSLTNVSTTTQQVIVRAGPAAIFEEIQGELEPTALPLSWDEEQEETLQSADLYVQHTISLQSGENTLDRLTADELGRDARIWISLECATDESPCLLDADYILLLDPLECSSKEDCLSGWQCDTARGKCLECVEGDGSCAETQTCELGRCTPPQQSSCTTTPSKPSAPFLMLLVLITALLCKTRKRGGGKKVLGIILTSCLLLFAAPSLALAQQSVVAEFTFGAGHRRWTGESNQTLQPGLGFELEQELYFERLKPSRWFANPYTPSLGMGITLGASSFVARQDSENTTPLNKLHQNYPLRVGLRVRQQLWRAIYGKFSVDYARMGIGGDALFKQTGLDRTLHGGSLSLRAGYNFEPLILEIGSAYTMLPTLNSGIWGITFRLGVSNKESKTN